MIIVYQKCIHNIYCFTKEKKKKSNSSKLKHRVDFSIGMLRFGKSHALIKSLLQQRYFNITWLRYIAQSNTTLTKTGFNITKNHPPYNTV